MQTGVLPSVPDVQQEILIFQQSVTRGLVNGRNSRAERRAGLFFVFTEQVEKPRYARDKQHT